MHDRVVALVGAVGRLGRRQVGDAQQQLAQRGFRLGRLGGQLLLRVAEPAALGLELGGFVDLAVPPEGADLLGHLVDLLADLVAGAGQLPEAASMAAASSTGARSMPRRARRLPDTVEVGAQQAGVDHDCRR